MKNNLPNLALAILRIGASAMLLTHGIPKIETLFADTVSFPDPLGIGSVFSLILVLLAEVVASVFIIIGYRTKIAALFPIIMMTVALLLVHFNDPFGKKEKAVFFLLAFLVVFLAGPGRYSIDKR
ncbi:MAG: DoxX family protein [Bacteroidetes bacterium]|nr:DoxX family protein [Bacteroidota bacterium]